MAKNDLENVVQQLKTSGILYLLIVGAVCLLVFYLVFLPAVRKFGELSQQINEKKSNIARIQAPQEEYQALENALRETEARAETLRDNLFWERDISKFLDELTRLAAGSDIEFISLTPESNPPITQQDKEYAAKYAFARVPITVKIRGGYRSVVDFLKKIEEGKKFIKIEYIGIDSQGPNLHTHNIQLKFSILTRADVHAKDNKV